jgi:hypothetical protein
MSEQQDVWCSKCYGDHYSNDCHKAKAVSEYERGLEDAAKWLETGGVMLSIDPGETKADRVKRFALAMATEIRSLKGKP